MAMVDMEWIKTLKIGDSVDVWDRFHKVYSSKVIRFTPTRRIVLEGNSTFQPTGWIHKIMGSCYADRHLRKPTN